MPLIQPDARPTVSRSPRVDTGPREHSSDEEESAFETELDFGKYFQAFRQRWWLLAAGALVGGAAGLGVAASRPAQYEAVTTLLVDRATTPAAVSTARALLQNYTLAAETLRITGLNGPPHNLTPQSFVRSALRIQEMPGTNVVKVIVTLPDPNRAAEASRVLSAKSVELNRRVASEGTISLRDQLKILLDDAASRLQRAEQELVTFEDQAQVELLKEDTKAMIGERGELLKLRIDIEAEKGKLTAAEQEIQKHQPVLSFPRAVSAEAAMRKGASPQPLVNTAPSATRDEGSDSPVDPELLDLNNPFINPVHQTLTFQIATSRTRLGALEREQRERVDRKLGGPRLDELGELYRRQAALARLRNSYELAQQVHSDLTLRYEQSRTKSVSDMVQLQIIDPALEPDLPLPRKRPVMAALGLMIGLVLAALVAFALHVSRPLPA